MKYFLLICLLGIGTSLSAQTISTDKVWTMRYKICGNPLYEQTPSYLYQEMILKDEVLVDGMKCMKCYVRECSEDENDYGEWKNYHQYLCQQGEKIYGKVWGSTLQVVIDYSMQVGDTIITAIDDTVYITKYVVTAVSDTVFESSTDKTVRKCLYLKGEWSDDIVDVWVDGIGSLYYGVEGLAIADIAGSTPNLEKCQQGDEILYQREVPASPIPYDLDGDGVLTLNDITTLINIYLEKSE
ncbi:MAG: hypothetical protein IJ901_04145 [Bacteroidaceae bacterium]|nr:hypothetical protein [Bacteroidaceae bacterium]